jgi:hypothetical protein
VSADSQYRIQISRRKWRRLMAELARRGQGTRESGAFLLARADRAPRSVAATVFFDDLDTEALNGTISIRGEAFARLWALCAERGMRVIADVHTHPGTAVGQSHIDSANPMVAQCGHVGIIVPSFAEKSWHPRDVGFHVYRGDRTWSSAFGADAAALLRRTWW